MQDLCERLPTRIEDINAAWLNQILGGVRAAQVIRVVHGTATKICMEIAFEPPRSPQIQRIWIKTGMEPHSADRRMDNVYAGETLYYRQLADRYQTRTPKCYFAATDREGHSVIVLDDLEAAGAHFIAPAEAGSVDFVARAIEAIARYQAASWMAPELYAVDWLRTGGSHRAYDFISWLYEISHWREYMQLPRFQKLAPELRNRELLIRAHRRLQDDFWPQAPWALAHGDCHYGQAYQLPGGEVRFLDWQAVQIAHWAHDYSYFVAGALAIDERRRHERELLHHYLGKLNEFGVTPVPDEAQAWLDYRAHLLHGIGWVMCPVQMQPEENCSAFAERFSTAIVDHDSLGLILGASR